MSSPHILTSLSVPCYPTITLGHMKIPIKCIDTSNPITPISLHKVPSVLFAGMNKGMESLGEHSQNLIFVTEMEFPWNYLVCSQSSNNNSFHFNLTPWHFWSTASSHTSLTGLLLDVLSLFLVSSCRDMIKDLVSGPGQQVRRALASKPEDFRSIPGT